MVATSSHLQLLREWPPGFGGVERVAHELALVWLGPVYCFDTQSIRDVNPDPLTVSYPRIHLPSLKIGRLCFPIPSFGLFSLLFSSKPLHGHLPSPEVLFLLVLARLLQPRRSVTAHWHCFLEFPPGFIGFLSAISTWFALASLSFFSGVITTSPVLADELVRCGCSRHRIFVLPCCLSAIQESAALALPERIDSDSSIMRLLFIGRLDSYKRVDWLLEALVQVPNSWRLDIIGDGPNRIALESQAKLLFGSNHFIHFHGRLDENAKLFYLAHSDVLVLPSDRCNEAFGIVQLEAMASGVPALAFQLQRSGMGWVCHLRDFIWSQKPSSLVDVLCQLQANPAKRTLLGRQSRERYRSLFQRSVWFQQLQQWSLSS